MSDKSYLDWPFFDDAHLRGRDRGAELIIARETLK